MRIHLKLTAGFLIVAVMVGLVAYLGHVTSRKIQGQLEQLSRGSIVQIVDATKMRLAVCGSRLAAYELLEQTITGEAPLAPRQVEQAATAIEDHHDAFSQSVARSREATNALLQLATLQGHPELASQQRDTLETLSKLGQEFSSYRRQSDRFLELLPNDLPQAGRLLRGELQSQYRDQLLPLMEQFGETAEGNITRGIRRSERDLSQMSLTNSAAALVASFLAVGLGLLFAHSIGKPLGILRSAALEIGQGNLDQEVRVRSGDELGVLAKAFNHMVERLKATTVSKAYVDSIIDSMREMLFVVDGNDCIQKVNYAVQEELQYSEQELLGKPWSELFGVPPAVSSDGPVDGPVDGRTAGAEALLRTKAGAPVPVYYSLAELRDPTGSIPGWVVAAINITDRKRADDRIRASLQEKETLLKEVHHRVKNNLQVIVSLLNLQASQITDKAVVQPIRECQNRIRSMAMIHDQLYRSHDLAEIDFARYVRELADHLIRSVGTAGSIEASLAVDPEKLPIDLAIPCGMIVNELLTNAIKHAFPREQPGRIEIGFHRSKGEYVLSISDNGIGMPVADGPTNTLGLKVVNALVDQVAGRLQIASDGGTAFTISFPAAAEGHDEKN